MEPNPHQLVSCPYNMAHQVEHYRMHIHLQKCRKMHKNCGKMTCPFDATHIVNDVELDYHVSVCPKRHLLDNQMYVMDDDYRPRVTVTTTTTSAVDSNEPMWDDYHVSVCPKRHLLDNQMYVMDDDYRPRVTVTTTTTSAVDSNEPMWDDVPYEPYQPDPAKKGSHMIIKIKGATPSERRKARMEGVKNYRPPQQ